MQQWLAQAPANIALIKYMGKTNKETNIPANPSLSYTLNHLQTYVSLESYPGTQDCWEPLEMPGADIIELSKEAQQRFLNHLGFIKSQFAYDGGFIVRSLNNFPMSTGLASSASSFAALTKCAVLALCELTQKPAPSIEVLAGWSRHGSGSSCRSFFSPWCLWENNTVETLDLPYQNLFHEVILVSHHAKTIPSSLAHELVKTSPLYAERATRATHNLKMLLDALQAKDWAEAYVVCWREFQDMHALFSSCTQPFSYMTKESHTLLQQLQTNWQQTGDGPIITMDAGPNIHLLYREDQTELARTFKETVLIGNFDVI